MKFCKVLEGQDKDFPELNHLFLRYKELKKKIRAIESLPTANTEAGASGAQPLEEGSTRGTSVLSSEEQQFIATLNEDLDRFNAFFMEKEEDAVINIQAMSDKLQQAAASGQQIEAIKEQLVNLHGELVLTLHWSLINYSAIVKILKKHDKRTGLLLRAPYLANVLQQPFSSTNVMSRLVKRAEEMVQEAADLTSSTKDSAAATTVCTEDDTPAAAAAAAAPKVAAMPAGKRESSDDEGSSITEIPERLQGPIAKRAKLVLDMWKTLAKSASTPSTILPTSKALDQAIPGSAGTSRCCDQPAYVGKQPGSPASSPRPDLPAGSQQQQQEAESLGQKPHRA